MQTHTSSPQMRADVVDAMASKLDQTLDRLEKAQPLLKSGVQTDLYQIAETLMGSGPGLCAIYERAPRFEQAGVFDGGPWQDASKLQPALVAGSLKSVGVYPVVETLSELRMLAIAKGRASSQYVTQQEAVDFLNAVMALNLEYLFPGDTEQERIEGGAFRDASIRLFAMLADELELSTLRDDVIEEIEQICAQRPVMTKRVQRMIELGNRIPTKSQDDATVAKLRMYSEALTGPSPLCKQVNDFAKYRAALEEQDENGLRAEAEAFAAAMHSTGLSAPQHAILLRKLSRSHPELLSTAFGVNPMGDAAIRQSLELVVRLIRVAILPSTCRCIYGFARLLESGALSRTEVTVGLERIVDLDLQTDVRRRLLSGRPKKDGASANAVLLAGCLAVLGQPLGIGQGKNPTCQAARGISLWAEHAPGFLLGLVIAAAREGFIEVAFEGATIRSDVHLGTNKTFDLELDPVSMVLVPHLDRVYEEMMRRVVGRTSDGHKWVNPGLYGRWVSSGFASAFDAAGRAVVDYEDFIRRFYATHHPAYNDGHTLMYPNPVGICITSSHGDYLGLHAVSVRRVADDPHGQLRVYFFNPNNEGRQDWGFGVKPTVSGYGEAEGESSLPFNQFASRIYAFHFNAYEEGDAFAVPDEVVESITQSTRESWGRSFAWSEY